MPWKRGLLVSVFELAEGRFFASFEDSSLAMRRSSDSSLLAEELLLELGLCSLSLLVACFRVGTSAPASSGRFRDLGFLSRLARALLFLLGLLLLNLMETLGLPVPPPPFGA